MIKIKLSAIILILFILLSSGFSQGRKEISIPNIPGYITLKCDFHMHTVFSDGTVWPTVRVDEAWLEGLDAISITDHLENGSRRNEIKGDDNKSYDLAVSRAESLGLLLVKGAEITKGMPPGHFNVLFTTDANPLDNNDHRIGLKIAHDQGAFVMWNHPGWKAQAPDSAIWYDEHNYLYDQDWFQGIEVFNSTESYGEKVYRWAKDKNLAIICNTDIHGIVGMQYDLVNGHRPMTLVFAKEKSLGGIKEALFARRTAAYFNDSIVGREEHLEGIFKQSIEQKNHEIKLKKGFTDNIYIYNSSDIDYVLILQKKSKDFSVPEKIVLKSHETTLLPLTGITNNCDNIHEINLSFKISNFVVVPDKNLNISFKVINHN